MNEDDRDLISRMQSHPLTETELQEARHAIHIIGSKMVSADQIKEWGAKVDRLWWAFGWLVLTVTNWKALAIAGGLMLLIGGQDMIDLMASRIGGMGK